MSASYRGRQLLRRLAKLAGPIQAGFVAATFVAATRPAQGSAIRVNGTCEVGSCTDPGILLVGQSNSANFDFTYQFANTDSYHFTGVFGAYNQTNTFGLTLTDLVVTYTGNQSGTSSGDDVINAEGLQNYAYRSAQASDYFEELNGVFGPGLGNASSASALFSDRKTSFPALGPVYAPGAFDVYKSGSTILVAGQPALDYTYTLTFGAGSIVGSSISVYPTAIAPTPEPTSLILLGTGLLGSFCVTRRRTA